MSDVQTSPSVFISYASPDRERVEPFYDYLLAQGMSVWMDCRNLKPGQNWDFEIERELDKAEFVLLFVSQHSVDRRGFVQRELKLALRKHTEKLVDDIYLLPILLDEGVPIPREIQALQCIRSSEPECVQQIIDAINHQLRRVGAERKMAQQTEGISWVSREISESWDGLPGYEVELHYFEFNSAIYPRVTEINDFIRGHLLGVLFEYRIGKTHQSPDMFNYGEDTFRRTNSYYQYCSEPTIIGKVLSIQHSVHWYGAGAAHPNHHFNTYNFFLEPLFHIPTLKSIFADHDQAFKVIQSKVREVLYKIRIGEGEDGVAQFLDKEWVDRGTSEWEDLGSFNFTAEGIQILFAPYHVGAYAFGAHSATIDFKIICPLLRDEFVSALNLDLMWSSAD